MTRYSVDLFDAFTTLIDRRPKGDDLDQYMQCSPDADVQAALSKLVENKRQEQAEIAARSIMVVMEAHQGLMTDFVEELRSLREREKILVRKVKAAELVGKYAAETGDFIPARKLLSGNVASSAQDLGVPNEWIVAYELLRKKKD